MRSPSASPTSGVSGGVKPRINGEQRVAEAITCRVERQGVASRQAALRLLRCAPALRVTRRNPLTQLAFMAGSRLPAVNDPLCENTAIQKVNPHILCSLLFGAFGSPSTSGPEGRAYGDLLDGLARANRKAGHCRARTILVFGQTPDRLVEFPGEKAVRRNSRSGSTDSGPGPGTTILEDHTIDVTSAVAKFVDK